MDPDEDMKVKRIARFLELGGTMLAEHCNVCGAPKFRYQGTVICPVCDVREESETQGPAAGPQVPEPRSYPEKDRSSFETQKRVQAQRPKVQSGLRTSEAAQKEEKALEPVEEKTSILSSEKEKERQTVPATPELQTAPSGRAEKPVASKISGIHGDRKILEDLLFKKMVNIATSLQDETDPRSIAEDLELIGKGLGLIERLRKL